jgi:hypothetical protein
MGTPRETSQVVLRPIIAEVIEQEEQVEVGRVAEAERTAQVDACALKGRLGFYQSLNWSKGYMGLLWINLISVSFKSNVRSLPIQPVPGSRMPRFLTILASSVFV